VTPLVYKRGDSFTPSFEKRGRGGVPAYAKLTLSAHTQEDVPDTVMIKQRKITNAPLSPLYKRGERRNHLFVKETVSQ